MTHRTKDYSDFKAGQAELLLGDFRIKGKKEIADESVHLIFTDPPYAKDMLHIWEDLGKFAARVLKPGGLLVSYSGSMYLPDIYNMLGKSLKYHWTAAVQHSSGRNLVKAANVYSVWKPVLIYYKPPLAKYWNPFADLVTGGQAKDNHVWEQSVVEATHFIKALCPPNGVLLDPMMGSGTSIIAGVSLGLKCVGIEIDKAAYAGAENRVKEAIDKLQGRKESA